MEDISKRGSLTTMDNPCLYPKCITYPICRNRIKIKCEKLSQYRNEILDDIMEETKRIPNQKELGVMWEHLNQYLPNLMTIDEPEEDTYEMKVLIEAENESISRCKSNERRPDQTPL